MKCLITGINGVVGSNLASILHETHGWDILGTGSSPSARANYFKADLTDPHATLKASEAIGQCDIVLHCAALIDMKRSPTDLFTVNVIGSLNALAMAKNIGARTFINISSIPVIGRIVQRPITESHPCAPTTVYHLSKLQAEQALTLAAAPEINVVNLRIPSPVGLNMPERTILPILLARARRNEEITLTGDKKRRQNYLDLRDLAHAVANSAERTITGTYNIASSHSVNNIELAQAILKATANQSVLTDKTDDSSDYIEDWNVDCAKAYRDFNYTSRHTIADSIDWLLTCAT